MKCKKNEKIKISTDYKLISNEIFGYYEYSYGNYKWNGNLEINKNKNGDITFELISVGKGEAPSIAQIELNIIKLDGNSFIYKIPETENCKFKITFYKDFAYVEDLGGDCDGQFGIGAYVDGIYIKTK